MFQNMLIKGDFPNLVPEFIQQTLTSGLCFYILLRGERAQKLFRLGAWVAHSVKSLTLGFRGCHGLRDVGWSPTLGSVFTVESA